MLKLQVLLLFIQAHIPAAKLLKWFCDAIRMAAVLQRHNETPFSYSAQLTVRAIFRQCMKWLGTAWHTVSIITQRTAHTLLSTSNGRIRSALACRNTACVWAQTP